MSFLRFGHLPFKSYLAHFVAIFFRAHMILANIFTHAQNCTLVVQSAMETEQPEGYITIEAACEYKALKDCLDRNQGRKEKCEKEWQEFQNLCATNKR